LGSPFGGVNRFVFDFTEPVKENQEYQLFCLKKLIATTKEAIERTSIKRADGQIDCAGSKRGHQDAWNQGFGMSRMKQDQIPFTVV
jgi:hypothetical protein